MSRRGECERWGEDGLKATVHGPLEGGHQRQFPACNTSRVPSRGIGDRCIVHTLEGEGEPGDASNDGVAESVPAERIPVGAEPVRSGSQRASVFRRHSHTAVLEGCRGPIAPEPSLHDLQRSSGTGSRISPRVAQQVPSEAALLSHACFLSDEHGRSPTPRGLADGTTMDFRSSIGDCNVSSASTSYASCSESGPLQSSNSGGCGGFCRSEATGAAPVQSPRDKLDQATRRARKITGRRPSEDLGRAKLPPARGEGGQDAARGLGSQTAATLELLECGVCCEAMQPPIFQCVEGHTLCCACKARVQQCPVCR